MDPNNPSNLDVWQMQEQMAEQAAAYAPPGGYDDSQAEMTGNRASFGAAPAMMMSGMRYAGAAGAGMYRGAGTMLSSIGSMVRPLTYTPPAHINTGYYGQYQQNTGFFKGALSTAGINMAPKGVDSYQYGYYNAASFGDRIGAGMVTAGSVGASIATMPMGSAIGGAIGGVMGAALGPAGMAIGGAVGSFAGSMLGYAGADAFGDVVAQRRAMNSFLESSSFRYVSAGNAMADPRMGGGMSASSRREATNFTRDMSFKDVNVDFQDLSNILQGSTDLGMLSGIKDMESFKKKFKDIVEGVKVVSKTLGTTLQEGLQVMKDMKAINIDASQMSNVAFQASAIGKASGRTASEIVGIGLQGAELFKGTGIEAKIGYQSNVMNMASIRSARDAGILSQESIIQAGGEEALAHRMTAGGLGFMQSNAGRGFGGTFFNPSMGPAGFDRASYMKASMDGGLSMSEMAQRSAQNLGNSQNVIKYGANQDKFMSEMSKANGGDTMIVQAQYAMGQARMYVSSGATKDINDALRYTLLNDMGKSPAEADTIIARIKNASGEFKDKMAAINNTEMQRTVDESLSTRSVHHAIEGVKREVGKFVEPAVGAAENVMDSTREKVLGTWEKGWAGVERADVSNVNYQGLSANATRKAPADRAMNLDKAWNMPLLGKSSGRQTLEDLKYLSQYDKSISDSIKTEPSAGKNDVILSESALSKDKTFVQASVIDRAQDLAQRAQISEAEALKMRQEGKTAKPRGHVINLLADKKLTESSNLDDVAGALFGKKFTDLSTTEIAEVVAQGSEAAAIKVPFLQEKATEYRDRTGRILHTTSNAERVAVMQGAEENIIKQGRALLPSIFNSDVKDNSANRAAIERVTSNLAAARLEKDPAKREELIRKSYGDIKTMRPDLKLSSIKDAIDRTEVLDASIPNSAMQEVYNSMNDINVVQSKAGFAQLNQMLDVEIKSGVVTGSEVEEARSAIDKFSKMGAGVFSKGAEGWSKAEREALSKTTLGSVVLESEKMQRAIEKGEKKAEEYKKSSGRLADPSMREGFLQESLRDMGLTLDKSVSSALAGNFAKSADDASQSIAAITAQQYVTSQAASGAISGLGSAESKGTAGGSAADAAALQMNINQTIRFALEGIAKRLKA